MHPRTELSRMRGFVSLLLLWETLLRVRWGGEVYIFFTLKRFDCYWDSLDFNKVFANSRDDLYFPWVSTTSPSEFNVLPIPQEIQCRITSQTTTPKRDCPSSTRGHHHSEKIVPLRPSKNRGEKCCNEPKVALKYRRQYCCGSKGWRFYCLAPRSGGNQL